MNILRTGIVLMLTGGLFLQTDTYEQARDKMVTEQIENRGINDRAVIDAMRRVKRHLFVIQRLQSLVTTGNNLFTADASFHS